MTHTLRDLIRHDPCAEGIEQLLRRNLGDAAFTEGELGMELTAENIGHCSTDNILWGLVLLGRLDVVVAISEYAAKVAGNHSDTIDSTQDDAAKAVWTADDDAAYSVYSDAAVAGASRIVRDNIHAKLLEMI